MRKYFYYDLHCHTNFSPDAPLTIRNLVKMAKKRGVDGVAVTDITKFIKEKKRLMEFKLFRG